MLAVEIELGQLMSGDEKTLGPGLRAYPSLQDLHFRVGKGTDIEQRLSLDGEHLSLRIEDDTLVAFLFFFHPNILCKVKANFPCLKYVS